MYRLSIDTSLSAAHQIRNYDGPCARLHGHNWKIRVHVSAEKLNNIGIAIDFKNLKELTWQVVGRFDHQNFNQVPPFDDVNPTAENIARYVFEKLEQLLPQNINIDRVQIWETEKYHVEYAR